jgi:hypothetical protein|tara:strand:- start:2034 stop:2150 length:117 start_codon:yes stop_codon:yes gene_type:complete
MQYHKLIRIAKNLYPDKEPEDLTLEERTIVRDIYEDFY